MSGRKQHYIPQCLLKGFEASRSGKHPQVVVCKRGTAPYISSIEGVAAKRHFYSELSADGHKTLDDRITEYENRLAPMLDELRSGNSGSTVDPLLAAEVVTHLTVRAAFLRDLFSLGAKELLSSASAFFSDSEAVREHLGIDTEEPNTTLSEEIDKVLNQINPPASPVPRAMLKRMVLFYFRETFTKSHGSHAEMIEAVLGKFGETLPTVIRDAHAKVLEITVAPDSRVKALAGLHWSRVSIEPESHVILPDCVAMSLMDMTHEKYESYLMHSNEKLLKILMPLSSNILLVGTRDSVQPDTNVVDVNRAAAKCAFDFFISARQDSDIYELTELIGNSPRATILETVRKNASKLFTKIDLREQAAHGVVPEINACVSTDDTTAHHTYAVKFVDCADQESAEQIASLVGEIVNSMSHHMPVKRIESITYANNYERALSELDRGFVVTTPLTTTSIEYGTGIAMAPAVLRGSGIQCCIVLRSWLGHALLSTDDDVAFRTAVHALSTMVARAAYIDLTDTALPNFLLTPIEDVREKLFFEHINDVFPAYFAARTTASIDPEFSIDYQNLFRHALKNAFERIPAARLEYRSHGDLDGFLLSTLSLLSNVLSYAATVMGHLDALGMSIFEDAETKNLIEEHELNTWIVIYQRDLERHYCQRGQWSSPRDFLSLPVHLERLLWQFGVFPWNTEDNNLHIEIPIGSDLAALITPTLPKKH